MEMELVQKELAAFLSNIVNDNKKLAFERVLPCRTRYVTLVLEDIFQAHNASAVLRSADCFGIQDVHFIENRNQYEISPYVDMGASKWLTLNRYNQKQQNTEYALTDLKQKGYRIIATTPNTNDILLPDFDLEKGKAAFIFGTELTGVSAKVMEMADEFVKIPMYGFTASFNISVSAALVLQELRNKMNQSTANWQLTEPEMHELRLLWYLRTVREPELVLKRFNQSHPNFEYQYLLNLL